MSFEPQPVDTSKVRLTSDIEELTEDLADHAHAVWARQRLIDGWVLGPSRNDELKQHPCLIPYDELDNSEQQYDRNAALETLKVIVAKGYQIVPLASEDAPAVTSVSDPANDSSIIEQQHDVVVFSGHMIDEPDRESPRFPSHLQDAVKSTIREWASSRRNLIGYSAAACGGDILFQEVIQELGGESQIVLPFSPQEFAKKSVEFAGEDWIARYERVLENATGVVVASPQRASSASNAFDLANQTMSGLALVRSAILQPTCSATTNIKPQGLVVWDGKPGGLGGTSSAVTQWSNLDMLVSQIDPSQTPSIQPAN
jgi:hypothetical protein